MNDIEPTRGKRIYLVFGIVLWVLVIGMPSLFIAWFMLSPGFFQEPNRRVITDPRSDFYSYTGLAWPTSAAVISSGDIRLEFLGDGEFHLVFDVDPATMKQWLAEAPWEQGEWQRGPVPDDISWRCGFGASGMSADPAGGGPDKNLSKVQVGQVLGSKQIRYAACDRASGWEHGTILILDPEHNRVWLSIWDF